MRSSEIEPSGFKPRGLPWKQESPRPTDRRNVRIGKSREKPFAHFELFSRCAAATKPPRRIKTIGRFSLSMDGRCWREICYRAWSQWRTRPTGKFGSDFNCAHSGRCLISNLGRSKEYSMLWTARAQCGRTLAKPWGVSDVALNSLALVVLNKIRSLAGIAGG